MSWVYKNANTGQVVTLQQRDACLDMLDNWRIISGPIGPAPASEQTDETGPASAGPVPPAASEQTDETGPVRPADGDNKAAWIDYAVARGMPEADAKALSKAALIEEFGEEGSDGED